MNQTQTRSLLFVVFSGIASAQTASAQIATYTDRLAWLAASSGVTTVDFTTAARPAPGTFEKYPSPPGLTLSGVNFANRVVGSEVDVVSQTFCCSSYARGFDQVSDATTGFQITLPAGTTSFGMDLFTVISGNSVGTNQDKVDITVNAPAIPSQRQPRQTPFSSG